MGLINPPNKKKRRWPPENHVKEEAVEVPLKKPVVKEEQNGYHEAPYVYEVQPVETSPVIKKYIELTDLLTEKLKISKLKEMRELLLDLKDDVS